MRMGACPGQYGICSKACIHGIRVCVCAYMRACMRAYMRACMRACAHHVFACVCVCVCACMHVH